MNARVLIVLSVHAFLSNCVTVNLNRQTPEIISNTKVELAPILITSGLNDIVVLSAPNLNAKAIYYLHKPNGDAFRLNFKGNETGNTFSTNHVLRNQLFNVNNKGDCCNKTDVFTAAETKMAPRDFMIGPLQEEDHGNWVLSAYYKDLDEHWIELFQVISIEIVEMVPLSLEKSQRKVGDDFVLGFKYPVSDLQSCQIEPPASTIDRFYDRTRNDYKCEFIMRNITLADEGIWTIIGVGRIVYKGTGYLHVRDKNFVP